MTSNRNKLSIEEICPGVYHIWTDFQFDLASTFLRVQEYYESPHKGIRKKYFTHEQYMSRDAYSSSRSGEKDVKFSYLEDWNGFNVPGNVFNRWVKLFSKDYLWEKEHDLVNLVYEQVGTKTNKFYVIGTNKESDSHGGDIDHELSHAWFYLDLKYRRAQLANVKKLTKTTYNQLTKHLGEEGYDPSVFDDEIVAYLSTNQMADTVDMFPEGRRIPWDKVADFQILFSETKEEKMDDEDN